MSVVTQSEGYIYNATTRNVILLAPATQSTMSTANQSDVQTCFFLFYLMRNMTKKLERDAC